MGERTGRKSRRYRTIVCLIGIALYVWGGGAFDEGGGFTTGNSLGIFHIPLHLAVTALAAWSLLPLLRNRN